MQHYSFISCRRTFIKSALLALILTMCGIFSVSAENQYGLTFRMKSGEKQTFILADKPVITFDDDRCVVDCGSTTVFWNMADIDLASFETVETSVSEVSKDNVTLDMSISSVVTVKGLNIKDIVTLFTLDGVLRSSGSADADGKVALSLENIPAGSVFIISINNAKNFKLYKK